MGAYLTAKLEQLKGKYAFIKEVRGLGLIIGMELTIEGGPWSSRPWSAAC